MTRSHLLWSGWGGRSQTMLQNAFFERWLVSDHPVCGWLSVASRLFIEAAATPPHEEGNAPTPDSLVIHSHVLTPWAKLSRRFAACATGPTLIPLRGLGQKFKRAPSVNLRCPWASVKRPNVGELMFRSSRNGLFCVSRFVLYPKFGWFKTLTTSTRNSNSLVSAIRTRLMRFASNPRCAGPSTHRRPRLPTWPGEGFTRRALPFSSVIARSEEH